MLLYCTIHNYVLLLSGMKLLKTTQKHAKHTIFHKNLNLMPMYTFKYFGILWFQTILHASYITTISISQIFIEKDIKMQNYCKILHQILIVHFSDGTAP